VRDVFDSNASDNTLTPSLLISLAVLVENEMEQQVFYHILSEVRDVLTLSVSDKSYMVLILLPVLSENEMKQQVCYR
jgi:hypothetical protein